MYNKEKVSLYACMVRVYLYLNNKEKVNPFRVIALWVISPTFRVNVWVEKMQRIKNPTLKFLLQNYIESRYSVGLPLNANIGRGFRIVHFQGVVIGNNVKIGDFCRIYQQVTLGQKDGKFPTIGNNVTIYAGAKIIGDVMVGDGAIVGANAVVTKDVPAGSVVAGVPARIIKNIKRNNNEFN